ncbi:hypothetical protein HPB49_002182 [Dermacentor silvarum]|uniref:Uncharacterized protein n=1 Tax=Dermacentor silvarum TaxID=543639 RepID=A0ACB8CUR1_DERSI|nr:hypothetical protein HPB49_002182 [Dermacentor silvarum]
MKAKRSRSGLALHLVPKAERGIKRLLTWSVSNETPTIVFDATTSGNQATAVAVDDITLGNVPCPSPGSCSFEEDMCNWFNNKDLAYAQWYRHRGATVSNSSGVEKDHTLGTTDGYYLLLDAYDLASVQSGSVQSQNLPLGPSACVKLYYFMRKDYSGSAAGIVTGVLVVLAIILIAAVAAFVVIRRRRNAEEDYPPTSRGIDSIEKKLGVFAGNAILEAGGLPPMAEADIVFNKNNQTILISTPNKERAEAFAKIKNIRAGEEYIEITAHLAMPEGGKGVIYGINLELTEEQIHKALDNPRNPTYTAVRRLGRSSESVIINFKDLEVPKTVKFFSQWIPCHLYKQKYDVCYACGKIGHRQDVRPDPRSTHWRGCGLRNPPEDHACEPKCLLCGKKRQLGDPTCRELYRKPHWVKQREQEKGGATAGRSRPTSKVALPPAAKKQRSESRDRSASRPPPRDNHTHWPGLQKPGDKRTHSGMPVSFGSAVSQGRTPGLEAQANLFKR